MVHPTFRVIESKSFFVKASNIYKTEFNPRKLQYNYKYRG